MSENPVLQVTAIYESYFNLEDIYCMYTNVQKFVDKIFFYIFFEKSYAY